MEYCPDCGMSNIHYTDTREIVFSTPAGGVEDARLDVWECAECGETFMLFYQPRPDDPPFVSLDDVAL